MNTRIKLDEKWVELKAGLKLVYTERNSVFTIEADEPNSNGFWLVYYPETGEYRNYSTSAIERNCHLFVKPTKKLPPPLILKIPGIEEEIKFYPDGRIIAGCNKTKRGEGLELAKKLAVYYKGVTKLRAAKKRRARC